MVNKYSLFITSVKLQISAIEGHIMPQCLACYFGNSCHSNCTGGPSVGLVPPAVLVISGHGRPLRFLGYTIERFTKSDQKHHQ
jgi:hypothetical protein